MGADSVADVPIDDEVAIRVPGDRAVPLPTLATLCQEVGGGEGDGMVGVSGNDLILGNGGFVVAVLRAKAPAGASSQPAKRPFVAGGDLEDGRAKQEGAVARLTVFKGQADLVAGSQHRAEARAG